MITSYVDDHPPDEFIHVKEGANYGWPFANPNPGTQNGLDGMPFAPNYETNPDWSKYPESIFTRIDKGIQAHSAPLGIAFLQDSKMPEPFREGIAIALRGLEMKISNRYSEFNRMSRCRSLKNHDFTEELSVIRAFEFHLFVRN